MAPRSTLNVSLTPDLSRFVESRLRSGRYQTASEVVREALRLLEARERAPVASIEDLKREIETGLAQLRRGEGVDGEAFFRRVTSRRRPGTARRR
jgi:antitoxin ParD1/3/4